MCTKLLLIYVSIHKKPIQFSKISSASYLGFARERFKRPVREQHNTVSARYLLPASYKFSAPALKVKRVLRNVDNYLPVDVTQHLRRLISSFSNVITVSTLKQAATTSFQIPSIIILPFECYLRLGQLPPFRRSVLPFCCTLKTECFQASAAKQMKPALFCVETQRLVVISYRRFGKT